MFLFKHTGMPSTYGKIPGIGQFVLSPVPHMSWIRSAVAFLSFHVCLEIKMVVTLFSWLAHLSAAWRFMSQRNRFIGVITRILLGISILATSMTLAFKSLTSSTVCSPFLTLWSNDRNAGSLDALTCCSRRITCSNRLKRAFASSLTLAVVGFAFPW